MITAAEHVKDLVRPRLRGVIHQWSVLVALVSAIVLLSLPQEDRVRPGTAIYGLTIVGLFSVSATYHRVTWSTARARALMKRADHSMIFVFIAGTFTPLALAVLHGTERLTLLICIWSGALCGVVTSTVAPHAPRWVTVPLYLLMGWAAVFMLPAVLHGGGVAALVLLAAGGLLYSVGAVCYGTRRPNPWPATFGYHEVFHSFTVVAAICHFIAVALVILR